MRARACRCAWKTGRDVSSSKSGELARNFSRLGGTKKNRNKFGGGSQTVADGRERRRRLWKHHDATSRQN